MINTFVYTYLAAVQKALSRIPLRLFIYIETHIVRISDQLERKKTTNNDYVLRLVVKLDLNQYSETVDQYRT